MLNGVPRYHTVKSSDPKIALFGRSRATSVWEPLANFVNEELVWNKRRLRVGGLADSLSHLRIGFSTVVKQSSFGVSGKNAKGYSSHKPNRALRLVFAVTDVAKRKRMSVSTDFNPISIEAQEYSASLDFELDLSDMGQIVTVRPLLVLSAERALDSTSGLTVDKGTILEEFEPFRVTLEQHEGGLSSVFEYRYVNFSEEFPNHVAAIHRHKLNEEAVLYINTDLEGIKRILQNEGSNSEALDVIKRDNLNCRIAEQVLGVELTGLARKLRSEFLEDPASIGYCLTAPERSLAEGWLHVLAPDVPSARRRSIEQAFREMVIGLANLSDQSFSEFMSQDLPSRIQHEIDSLSSTRRFLHQDEPEKRT